LRRLSNGGSAKHFELGSPMYGDETPKGQLHENQDIAYLISIAKDTIEQFPEAADHFGAFKETTGEMLEAKEMDYYAAMELAKSGNSGGQFNVARRFYDMGNYSAALYWYCEAATNVNIRAMNNLGLMYLEGECVEKSERLATMWLECASKRGDINAKTNLGIIVCKPAESENRDYDAAIKMFSEGAELGMAVPTNNLACCYARGFGSKVDYGKAMRLFKRAAESNSIVAKYNIGIMYLNGMGVRQSSTKAQKYFDEANHNIRHPEHKCLSSVNNDPTKFVFFTTMIAYTAAAFEDY